MIKNEIFINFMNQKNCIIIHGCPSNQEKAMNPKTREYDKHWMPWLKEKLLEKGIPAQAPLMPEPWNPDYEKFKAEFEKYPINKDTILIGHSCGCAFLVRWLGETKKEIAKLILVAPWKINDKGKKDKFRERFYVYSIDKNIKNNINKVIMFTANNEEDHGKESLQIFHKALGGEIIELKGHGHYCFEDMKTEEFPELLEKVLE